MSQKNLERNKTNFRLSLTKVKNLREICFSERESEGLALSSVKFDPLSGVGSHIDDSNACFHGILGWSFGTVEVDNPASKCLIYPSDCIKLILKSVKISEEH
jgi:hypothetical protein